MRFGTDSAIRVLVVDEEEPVRRFLQQELSAAGYEVDTLSSGTGFTEDMVALIRPDVLLVDPIISDVSVEVVEGLLGRLRQDSHLVLLLIDSGRNVAGLQALARACKADGQIRKQQLLAAPAAAVGEQLMPDGELEELAAEPKSLPTADHVHQTGEEILLVETQPPPRSVAQPAAALHRSPSRPDLLAMIHEELQVHPAPKPPPTVVDIEINLFSRHNFYVGSSGDLSTGGVFVVTAMLAPVGTRVPLKVTVASVGSVVQVEAVVEWTRQAGQLGKVLPGVGLSLAHLPVGQRKVLERFFSERAPLTYLPHRR